MVAGRCGRGIAAASGLIVYAGLLASRFCPVCVRDGCHYLKKTGVSQVGKSPNNFEKMIRQNSITYRMLLTAQKRTGILPERKAGFFEDFC